MSVVALLDHDAGAPAPGSDGLLTRARSLAESLGTSVAAVAMGAEATELEPVAADHGIPELLVATHDLLHDYGPETWAESLIRILEHVDADVAVAAGTDRGNEVMAHVAARSGTAMVANVTATRSTDPWTLERVRWGGSLLEEVRLDADLKLLTFATHTLEAGTAPTATAVRTIPVTLDDRLSRTVCVGREVEVEGLTLATAPVVVGGGRGVGSADGFTVLESLAERLGGVVGCSRVATNNGWRPHSDQVGQTGTRISPKLYIACGISGAIQHWVGAMGARSILAINTDPEANMVAKADYAVIGDLHEVVPAITDEIERRRT